MTTESKFKVGDKVVCNKASCPEKYKFDGEKTIREVQVTPNYTWIYLDQASWYMKEHEVEHAPIEYARQEVTSASFIIPTAPDAINPSHYQTGGMQLIDVMFAKMGKDSTNDFMWGSIIKYIFRFKEKNGLQDLEKAQWYLNKLIQTTKEEKHHAMGKEG